MKHFVVKFSLALMVLGWAVPAEATFSYWDANGATAGASSGSGKATGTWGVDAYWSTNQYGTNATTGWTAGNVAIFSAGSDATNAYTITVSGPQNINFLSFEEGTVTLSGGSLTRTDPNGTANVAPGATAILNTTLSDTNGLTKGGGGNLIFAVAQPYTGSSLVQEGILRINGQDFVPTGTAMNVSNNPSGTFDLNGFNQTIGSLTGNGTVTLGSGLLTAGGDGTSTTFAGTISGTGGLTKMGNGTMTLTGANSYSGATTVAVGTLKLGASGVLADNSSVSVIGGTLDLGSFTETVGPVTLTSGSITGVASEVLTCGTVDIFSGAMQPYKLVCGTINLYNGTLATGSATANGFGITCSGGLNINGGTATLAPGGTFANDVTLNSGTLIIGSTNVVGSGTLWLNGGTIQHVSATARIITNAVSLGGDVAFNVPASLTFSGPVTLTGKRILTVNNTNTISGSIGEDAAGRGFTKVGPGVLSLTGAANSYSGPTTNSAGMIQLNATSTLGNGSGNLVLNGGSLVSTAARTVTVSNAVIMAADSSVATVSTSTAANFDFGGSIGGSAGTLSLVNNSPSTGTFKPRFSAGGFNFARPIVMTPGSLSFVQLNLFNTTGTDQTFSGVISGDGSINRSASVSGTGGRSIFAVANTYTGTTTINDGTLQIGNSAALGGVAATYPVNQGPGTTINANGSLDLNGLALGEDISTSGGQIINTSGSAATLSAVDGGVKAITFTAGGTNITGGTTVSITGGGGTGATATASLGVTSSTFPIDPGSSYTAAPTVTISAPSSGITATATATITKNGGSNYATAPLVVFNGGGGSGASYTAQISAAGAVTNFVKVSAGSGYTTAPSVSFNETGTGGTGATAIATMSAGTITAVTLSGPVTAVNITGAGSGYTTAPTIVFSSASTNGVTATSTGNSNQFTVVSVTTTASGGGYTTAPTVTLSSGSGFTGRAVLSSGLIVNGSSSVGGTGDIAINSLISGTSSLTKIGNDTVTLNNNNNSYSGGTLISAGTLKAANTSGSATGSGSVTVSGGILSGTGIIGGAVVVTNGGQLAPGAGVGTLTLQSGADLSGGGVYTWELGALSTNNPGTSFDQLSLTGGNLVLGGTSMIDVHFTGSATAPNPSTTFWQSAHSWKVAALSGGATNVGLSNFGSVTNGTYAAGTFSTSVDGSGNIILTFAIPITTTNQPVISRFTAAPGATNTTLSWSTQASLNYQVQYKSNLNQIGWLPLTNVTATGSSASVTVDCSPSIAERYFRIIVP